MGCVEFSATRERVCIGAPAVCSNSRCAFTSCGRNLGSGSLLHAQGRKGKACSNGKDLVAKVAICSFESCPSRLLIDGLHFPCILGLQVTLIYTAVLAKASDKENNIDTKELMRSLWLLRSRVTWADCKVDAPDVDGTTPLIAACSSPHTQHHKKTNLVQCLLDLG